MSMNQTIRILFTLIVWLIVIDVCAQEKRTFYRVEHDKYFYDLSIRKLHKFSEEFVYDSEVESTFKKFDSKRKIQRFINYLGIIVTAPYAIPGCIGSLSDRSDQQPVYEALCLGGIAFSGVFIIPANAIFGKQKSQYRKRLFNKMSESQY